MAQTGKRTTDAVVYDVVHQRFLDQITADEASEIFLMNAASRFKDARSGHLGLNLKWWNLEGDDGRVDMPTELGCMSWLCDDWRE